MHGLRNDFIIVDSRGNPFSPSREQVQIICDRREGVGGHELLIVEPPSLSDAKENIMINANTMKLAVWERPGALTTARRFQISIYMEKWNIGVVKWMKA
jgi:hypothetical protein